MKKSKSELPVFKNLQEVADFWDSHEFTGFSHEFKPVKDVEASLNSRMHLPITLAMYEKMEQIAISRGVSVDALLKQWVEEKLAEY